MAYIKITEKIIHERLAAQDRGVTFIDEFNPSVSKTKDKHWFQCPKNDTHKWESRITDQISKNPKGCPHCANNQPSSKDKVNKNIEHLRIEMVGDYVKAHTKSKFLCKCCNHVWYARPTDFQTPEPNGCPMCAHHGFKIYKPGFLYVLQYTKLKCLKYGITNYPPIRITKLSSQSPCTVVTLLEFDKGWKALEIEQAIKKHFGTKHVTKEQLPDGYTETLPLELKEELLSCLNI